MRVQLRSNMGHLDQGTSCKCNHGCSHAVHLHMMEAMVAGGAPLRLVAGHKHGCSQIPRGRRGVEHTVLTFMIGPPLRNGNFSWVDHAGVTPVFPAFLPFCRGILDDFRVYDSTNPQQLFDWWSNYDCEYGKQQASRRYPSTFGSTSRYHGAQVGLQDWCCWIPMQPP